MTRRAKFNIEEASRKLIRMFRYFLLRMREAKSPTSLKHVSEHVSNSAGTRSLSLNLTGSYLLLKVQPSTLYNHSFCFQSFCFTIRKPAKVELQPTSCERMCSLNFHRDARLKIKLQILKLGGEGCAVLLRANTHSVHKVRLTGRSTQHVHM